MVPASFSNPQSLVLIAAAGALAGAMNALAGGGSFVTLPALIATGVPSVAANATSTLALYPGGLASAWVYRDGTSGVGGARLRDLALVTIVGGLLGAALLVLTPSSAFDKALPWLLLVATLALAFGRRLGQALRSSGEGARRAILPAQFLLAVYAGYFGGAAGLMMMAAWSLLDGAEVATLSAPRTLMVSAANTAAVVLFALSGVVVWSAALLMGLGALAGGYLGAHAGKRLDPKLVRIATLALSVLITLLFFVRAYRP